MTSPHSRRAGMTLVELMVALTIFGIVVTTSVAFMAKQNAAFQDAIHRLVVLRNLRYSISTLSQDLETLGTNVPDAQPALLYADEDVVAFSADYATNLVDDDLVRRMTMLPFGDAQTRIGQSVVAMQTQRTGVLR